MLPHPLTNSEIQKCQKEPKFNGVYSWNNLPKIKDGAHIINLVEYESIGTHLIAFCIIGDNVTYVDSFGLDYIKKEVKKFIDNKSITNIYRI